MSEKQQRNAAHMREKMNNRYGDGLHHKHDKCHLSYRHHYKTHPANTPNGLDGSNEENTSTGLIRTYNLRKVRKRLDKGRFH